MDPYDTYVNSKKVVPLISVDADVAERLFKKWNKEKVDTLFVIDLCAIRKRLAKYNWVMIGFMIGNLFTCAVLHWFLHRIGMAHEVFSR